MFRASLRRGSCRGWRRGCKRARPLFFAVSVLIFAVASPTGISRAAGRAVTRARARAAYVAVLLAGALAQTTAERETLARQLEDSVRARVDVGAASEIELRLAEVERGRMHRERVDAQRLAGEASAELLALLALP